MSPKISILMPAFNAASFIDEAILSIINQTYTNWELIICDDSSTDQTYSIASKYAKEYSNIIVLQNKTNQGYLVTCNLLVEKMNGEIIGFQDADDISKPTRLALQMEALVKRENCFVGCDMELIKKNGQKLSIHVKKEKELIKEYPSIGDSTMLIPKKHLKTIGGLFRPELTHSQDYDLGLRLLDYFSYFNVDSSLYLYRNVDGSDSKNYSSPEKIVGRDLCRYLAAQRREKGKDDIMSKDKESLNYKIKRLLNEYKKKPLMLEVNAVSRLVSIKMYNSAIKIAFRGITKKPFMKDGYFALFYAIRQSIKNMLSI